jgi:hypothetical protein
MNCTVILTDLQVIQPFLLRGVEVLVFFGGLVSAILLALESETTKKVVVRKDEDLRRRHSSYPQWRQTFEMNSSL